MASFATLIGQKFPEIGQIGAPQINSLGGLVNAKATETVNSAISSIQSKLPANKFGRLASNELTKFQTSLNASITNRINDGLQKLHISSIGSISQADFQIQTPNFSNILHFIGATTNPAHFDRTSHEYSLANIGSNPLVLTGFDNSLSQNIYANSANQLGLVNKAAATSSVSNSPQAVMNYDALTQSGRAKDGETNYWRWPLRSDKDNTNNYFCIMKITAFKYCYDANDISGNKRMLDAENASKIKKMYTIELPMPSGLPSVFSSSYEPYSSVWSKLVRSFGGNAADLKAIPTDPEGITSAVSNILGDPQLAVDALKTGTLAGLFTGLTGGGWDKAVGDGATEAMNYIRVNGGITVNPMSQQAYTGTAIREHLFEFNMAPRNKREQEQIFQIISHLEDSSLGTKKDGVGGLLLNFPDLFNVQFLSPFGKPIMGMIEIPDSFLSEVSVVRSPTRGIFQITQDENPYPIAYTLSFKLLEAQNLTRNDMKYLRQTEIYQTYNPNEEKDPNFDITKLLQNSQGDSGSTTPSPSTGGQEGQPDPNGSTSTGTAGLVPDQGGQGPTTQNPPDNTQQRVESATDNAQNPPR